MLDFMKKTRYTYIILCENGVVLDQRIGNIRVLPGVELLSGGTQKFLEYIEKDLNIKLHDPIYLFDHESTYYNHKVFFINAINYFLDKKSSDFDILELVESFEGGLPEDLMNSSKNIISDAFVENDFSELIFAQNINTEKNSIQSEIEGFWDPADPEDARKKTMRLITMREGQPKFRSELLNQYDGKCVFTGCSVLHLLEAAHIIPYKGTHTNDLKNGLIMRADFHKLFDLHLICIDSKTRKLKIHNSLKNSEYKEYEGRLISKPKDKDNEPTKEILIEHQKLCIWSNI